MNELTKGLTNLRSLRAAVRDLTLEQAESSLLKLQAAVEEKRAQAAEIEQAEQERRARIAKYKELLEKEGYFFQKRVKMTLCHIEKFLSIYIVIFFPLFPLQEMKFQFHLNRAYFPPL